MAAPIRIKRRAGGAPGAPTELLNAELAFNEVDDTLYYGKGTGGAGGSATSVVAIGGDGSFVTLATAQTITGAKAFGGVVTIPTPTANYHPATKLYVDQNIGAISKDWADIINKPSDIVNITDRLAEKAPLISPALTGTPTAPTAVAGSNTTQIATTAFVTTGLATKANTSHTHPISDITNLQTTLNTLAPKASPTFTGNVLAPTPASGDSSTKVATTAFVVSAIHEIIGAAPGALDTLAELAAALGDDPDFAGTISTELATKLTKTSNLSDLDNIVTSRANLGLGSMAVQNANAVAITGGTINNIVIDGGIF